MTLSPFGKPQLVETLGTQNFSNRPTDVEVDMIIIHSMAEIVRWGNGVEVPALDVLTRKEPPDGIPTNQWSRVSAHYYIGPDAVVREILSPTFKAWHAGASRWAGREDLNRMSIGIEIGVRGIHGYDDFPTAISSPLAYYISQYRSAAWLCAKLIRAYGISLDMVRGHSEISGDDVRGQGKGKVDPGRGFLWRDFYGWLTWCLVREPEDV